MSIAMLGHREALTRSATISYYWASRQSYHARRHGTFRVDPFSYLSSRYYSAITRTPLHMRSNQWVGPSTL